MRKFLFCFTYVILSSSAALAIEPCEHPSCETLGYSQSNTANCTEYLHCVWDASYKKCVAIDDDTCSKGQLSITCGDEIGDTPTQVSTTSSGKACYECQCFAPAECTWTEANKGEASLSDKCCNGNYQTCTSTCTEVELPANAIATSECSGCGTTVPTAWKCDTGYTKSANQKACYKTCEVGWIVYSDFTCEQNYNSTKWAIGVVTSVIQDQLDVIALRGVGLEGGTDGKGQGHDGRKNDPYFDPDGSCETATNAYPVLTDDCIGNADNENTYYHASVDDVLNKPYKPCAFNKTAWVKNIDVKGITWRVPNATEAKRIHTNLSAINKALNSISTYALSANEFIVINDINETTCGSNNYFYYTAGGKDPKLECPSNTCDSTSSSVPLRLIFTINRSKLK